MLNRTFTSKQLLAIPTLAVVASLSSPTIAADTICNNNANLAFRACKHESIEDALIDKANCLNIANASTRQACKKEVWATYDESIEFCGEQADARRGLCSALGENRYDPTAFWQAENFVDPLTIGDTVAPNSYFPLVPGISVLENEDEIITVTVTSETKLISGVTCLTVNDLVTEDGLDVEDTDDWYAQDVYGNVWYCGEISENYEFFPGDNPQEAELVDVEGSWKAFRDGAMPGYLMLATPTVGAVYRQEVLLGDAEDAAEIIAIDADGFLEGDACQEDGEEIKALIDELCQGDCLVTSEFTPVEPDVAEHKYYAPNIGLILETNPEGECTVLSLF